MVVWSSKWDGCRVTVGRCRHRFPNPPHLLLSSLKCLQNSLGVKLRTRQKAVIYCREAALFGQAGRSTGSAREPRGPCPALQEQRPLSCSRRKQSREAGIWFPGPVGTCPAAWVSLLTFHALIVHFQDGETQRPALPYLLREKNSKRREGCLQASTSTRPVSFCSNSKSKHQDLCGALRKASAPLARCTELLSYAGY